MPGQVSVEEVSSSDGVGQDEGRQGWLELNQGMGERIPMEAEASPSTSASDGGRSPRTGDAERESRVALYLHRRGIVPERE